ncbi:tRNA (adenosine(37)-N6)-threonylcarbamoyltransferase complex dimerization subunit type 1 TsaB [Mycoplasmopsis verecunda]|uniref:tRNA threonylcarbamoyl adenosine modification protein YeaZ n=1 Tax=Mycoplasmopsis verecunda TaxID=171291 RepID=A0A1T4LHY2_9BACT|nr:tRNA (adenosine(37)-N6)-threonylcarbamoyltransferase complex dimerization subunit type 1 TsaB [Mycoplasmopsis verecunda]WPB54608.1 tRNA (adenosine(37)-N6)-threonylcarbamoyltransferase complex dimerization subunit type 1 TsaB [Mycoplasmopsis verecunda]SJZ54147.1 tRNA threonylcarbamoyl adenosine modification protein YeaZ [Mycoplasmopsis verecunda]
MNVYLDTSSEDFVLVLFNQEFQVLDFILLEGYKKKVELITNEFAKILQRNNLQIKDLTGLYTNIGPGFFTGVRSSLVFFRTLALLNKIDLYITTTLDILHLQHSDKVLFTDAQGHKLYQYNFEQFNGSNYKNVISVVDKTNQEVVGINFKSMIQNFTQYKDLFIFKEPMNIEVLYIKQPQIGGTK